MSTEQPGAVLQPAPVTRQLGAFAAGIRGRNIPVEAFDTAKLGFTDCVGVMLAGSVEDAPNILKATLEAPRGASSVYLGNDTVPALEAALINGTAAHALDYDDVALRGHPSTVIVPAILAEAEALGSSGRDMVLAFIAGYEVWAELAWRDPDNHHMKGWHPTGIFGAVGAAAACAVLHGLDAEKTAHAIALGASGSAGLMANFGTMSKPFHAGQSARAGVLAARLAKAGFTGSLDALEHPQGFLSAVSPGGKVDRTSGAKAGDVWRILESGLNIKKYPLCYCTHRALDCMLDLVKETPVKPEDVSNVVVFTSRRNATILRNKRPQTGLEAKFSMEFAMASSLVAHSAGLKELTDDFVRRDDVQSLFPKIRMELDDREHPSMPGHSPYDQVTIELKDGRKIASKQLSEARGAKLAPLYPGELEAKFKDCMAIGRPGVDHKPLFDKLQALETVKSVAELVAAASSGGASRTSAA